MSIVTKRACTSNSREPQKLIMFIDSDYTFSWLDHNIRTCCKQIRIKIQCLFRLDRFVGWLALASKIRQEKKRKLKLSSSCRLKFICDCITVIVFAVTKNCLLCVRIEIALLNFFLQDFMWNQARLIICIVITFYIKNTCDFINWLQHALRGVCITFFYRSATIKTIHFEFNQ